MHIRMFVACAAFVAALFCFGGAHIAAVQTAAEDTVVTTVSAIPGEPLTLWEKESADTENSGTAEDITADEIEEMIDEISAQGALTVPMSGRFLDEQPLTIPTAEETPASGTDAVFLPDAAQVLSDAVALVLDEDAAVQHIGYQMDLDIAEREELRRIEEEAKQAAARQAEARRKKAEEKRRAEERKAAEEAAKQAACPGYNADFVATLTAEEQKEAEYFYEQGYVFYRQNWSVMNDLPYGDDGFGLCGCGPTCVAAIIANLAGTPVTPEDMRQCAIEHNCYLPNRGTTYDFMISVPAQYGIKATQIYSSDSEALFAALRDENKLVLATMGPGDFTLGAHFMLFRGITDEGKILIADSYSYEFSVMEWDYEDLYAQLKAGYWIFELAE